MEGTKVNEALRGHVTRVGFNLTLTVGQISALIALDEAIRRKLRGVPDAQTNTPWSYAINSNWVTGMHGLERRGLVNHHYDERYSYKGKLHHLDHIGRHYKITKAGKLVIEILKEAGIYEEILPTLIFKDLPAA